MKINSHLLGIGLAVGAGVFLVWNEEKDVEVVGEYHIYKKRNTYYASRIYDQRLTNPRFDTIEEVRTWIAQQQALEVAKAAAASIIPWGN